MNKKLVGVVGIAALIVTSSILYKYIQDQGIRIIGSVRWGGTIPAFDPFVDVVNEDPPYYVFYFRNEKADLYDVNFKLTLRGEFTEEVTIKRYWGEWKRNEDKKISVFCSACPAQIQGYGISLECNQGKPVKINWPFPKDVDRE